MKIKSSIVVYASLLIMLGLVLIGAVSIKNTSSSSKGCNVINSETIYLAVGESYTLPELEDSGSIFRKNQYKADNEGVSIEDNVVTGISDGTTTVTFKCNEYVINVSSLYTKAELNNDKEFLPCGKYTQEENEYLDEVLAYKINEAGYMTRAGAVEAARFLTLQFPYKLSYFYENGRLAVNEGYSNEIADGEGRFYHTGLYLNEYKYSILDSTKFIEGPATWGCSLYSVPQEEYEDNGFDCSGFVTWILYNAGYTEVGDIGAGPSGGILDLSDIGKKVYTEDLTADMLQVGDLLGFDGHITMIIGIDEENIYIAQDYWVGDMSVLTLAKSDLKISDYEYGILMDNFYINDGNITEMWY